ncbi:MAG: hypothetical protein LBM05_00625 [Endomicrobium sp.]|jgi:hypothetical protein|nr:hypothetical protein [Endomicrobium sp.]
MEISVNEYQTPINDELFKDIPDEIKEQFLEDVNTIPYIQWMISPKRTKAKDLPRDKRGRIIVDIAHPHILEDMDYFIKPLLHFKKHGCYTFLRPNKNPNSDYYKWAQQEVIKCLDGCVRESDGEWIPGNLYYYLNYTIMDVVKKTGNKKGERVRDFPVMWEGIYLRAHYKYQAEHGGLYNNFEGGQHGAELASRGKGKSYSAGADMAHNFLFGNSLNELKGVKSLILSNIKEYISLSKDGTLNKFVGNIDFSIKNMSFTPNLVIREKDTLTFTSGYNDITTGILKGSGNIVMGVSTSDDIAKVRGKRASLILIEEFGSYPNLESLFNILLPSVSEGEFTYGLIYMQGTAGDKDSDFSGAEKMIFSPKGYNLYAIPNVYSKVNSGKDNFVYFFPEYINRLGYYDKNGVSDVVGALMSILKDRYKVKNNTLTQDTILRTIAEKPIVPEEAITKVLDNIFPTKSLSERLTQIDSNDHFFDDVLVGNLELQANGEVKFVPDFNVSAIRDFPHKTNKIEGAIEIYNLPQKDVNGKIIPNRYIAGCDPYDDDASTTTSLISCFILDLFTDQIVAEYTGRPMFADDAYEQVRKLCLFYNARLNYENNKKGMYPYFKKMNSSHYLIDTPEYLLGKNYIKGGSYGNKSVGTPAVAAINNHARTLIRDWFILPKEFVEINSEQIEERTTKLNLFHIKSRALLKEAISWNIHGNFDRVSALGMLMIYRQELMAKFAGNIQQNLQSSTKKKVDDCFSRSYAKIQNKRNRNRLQPSVF